MADTAPTRTETLSAVLDPASVVADLASDARNVATIVAAAIYGE